MAKLNGKTPEQIAHEAIEEAKAETNAFEAKVKEIAAKLSVSYQEAFKLVEGEQKRKEAGKRYRQSEAYKLRLEQQKVVRAMLK